MIVDGDATEDLYPGAAFSRYGQDKVRLQQIIWPDTGRRLPWEDDYSFAPYLQPFIGQP